MRTLHTHSYSEHFRHMIHSPVFWLIVAIAIFAAVMVLAIAVNGGGGGSMRYPPYYPYFGIY